MDCRFETGALAETFQATGERAASLAQHQHEQARTLVASFEAPFKACHANIRKFPASRLTDIAPAQTPYMMLASCLSSSFPSPL